MGLSEDLQSEVKQIFSGKWDRRDGYVVPDPKALKLYSNEGRDLDAVVLYADMAESTELVNQHTPTFAAEVYKAFLTCCAKIIRDEGGEVTAYDGDRVMGVYLGDVKNTSAVRTALKINYAVQKIIMPALAFYNNGYVLRHAVGVDTSKLLVARVGVRDDNDLVWVGRAANYAAKLCALRDGDYTSWITGEVYDKISKEAKIASDGRNMWEERSWTARNKMRIFRSSWRWTV